LNRIVKLRATSLDLLLPHPVDRDVHHDAIDPGVEARLTAEAADRFPRLQETILGQIPGVLLAMHHVVNHTKNSRSVAADQLIEGLRIARLAS
jgi:hypothetical protein